MDKKHKTVRRVFNLSDIAIIAGVALVGVIFILMVKGWSGLGWLILLFLLCMLPFIRHGWRIEGHQGVFSLRDITVNRESKKEILAYLAGDADTLNTSPRANGGAVVNIYSRKNGPVLANYFEYENSACIEETDLHEISPDKKARLLALETKA